LSVMRVKAKWTIPGAGTAFSVFHFGDDGDSDISSVDANSAVAKVHTFFGAVKAVLPNVVKVDVLNDVEHINVTTGDLEKVVAANAVTTQTGTAASTAGWAAPAGVCITWTTNGIRQVSSKPRRVRGRTFIVPVSQEAYDIDGTIKPVQLGQLQTAANNLAASGSGSPLLVYGRPGPENSPAGQAFAVTAARITDQVAILRSRRS